jgi:HAD superfamily hydrolase (TIGR01509 family)
MAGTSTPEKPSKPPKLPLLAVVFDLDGVLVSSAEAHWEAYRRTFAAEGVDFSYEEYHKVAQGVPREVVVRRVFGDLPAGKAKALMAAKEAHLVDYLREGALRPIPGAMEFVDEVRRRGLKIAVATASRTPKLLLEAAGIRRPFDLILDRTDVKRPKPFPDIYQAAARALGLEPPLCLAIEDSPPGIEAAIAAGMPVLALSTTYPRQELLHASAVYAGFDEIDLERWLGTTDKP